jgi:hypothetical protein
VGSATFDDAEVGVKITRGGDSNSWTLVDNTGGATKFKTFNTGTPTATWLTSTNGTSFTEQMRLNPTGLGIKNTNPTAALDVTGSALVSGSVTAASFGGALNGTVGATTASTGAFTTLTTSSTVTHNGGTANGVTYLNGSKVLTSGSALTFDGTLLTITAGDGATVAKWKGTTGLLRLRPYVDATIGAMLESTNAAESAYLPLSLTGSNVFTNPITAAIWQISGTEGMRLTSTGLGIGTSSPSNKLVVSNSGANGIEFNPTSGQMVAYNRSTSAYSTLTLLGSSFAIQTGTSPVSRLVINDSGNLGLGTTSPTSQFVVSNAGAAGLEIQPTGVGSSPVIISYNRSGAAYTQLTNLALQHVWQNSGTEVARIDSSGNLFINDTANATGSNAKLYVLGTSTVVPTTLKSVAFNYECSAFWNNATSGNNVFASFNTETSITGRGSISYNRAGGLVVYNTTSDYRAKDISGPVTNSGTLIDSVPVYMGKMKWATEERPMFIAHEVPAYAHTGEKDAVDVDGNPVYQQMDASALIPVMWAEIQSLRQRLSAANL